MQKTKKVTTPPSPNPLVNEWWKEPEKNMVMRESILLYGPPKFGGKTYSYIDIMYNVYKNNKNTTFYLINTDGGFFKTFQSYCYNNGVVGDEYVDFAKHVKFFACSNLYEIATAVDYIIVNGQKGDWVIIDLASDPWDWGQKEVVKQVSEAKGVPKVDFIKQAVTDDSFFGPLKGLQWAYVKDIEEIYHLVLSPKFNIIGVYVEKSVDVEKALHESAKKKKKTDGRTGKWSEEDLLEMWSVVGTKPAGNPKAAYRYDTIIHLTARVNPHTKEIKRVMTIMGDRGNLELGATVAYKNFWKAFQKYRRAKNPLYAKKPTTPPPQSPKKLENVKNPSPPPEHSNMEEENEW